MRERQGPTRALAPQERACPVATRLRPPQHHMRPHSLDGRAEPATPIGVGRPSPKANAGGNHADDGPATVCVPQPPQHRDRRRCTGQAQFRRHCPSLRCGQDRPTADSRPDRYHVRISRPPRGSSRQWMFGESGSRQVADAAKAREGNAFSRRAAEGADNAIVDDGHDPLPATDVGRPSAKPNAGGNHVYSNIPAAHRRRGRYSPGGTTPRRPGQRHRPPFPPSPQARLRRRRTRAIDPLSMRERQGPTRALAPQERACPVALLCARRDSA